MSHNIISQTIKIKIVPTISGLATHEELGVYVNEDTTQEIRWSEQLLTNTAQIWANGILAGNGIGDRVSSGDTRRGGTPEEYSGLSIQALNGNQLILRLKELGININGLTAELWEFESDGNTFIGGALDSDNISATRLFSGVCEYESASIWNENIWQIQIKNNRFQRNACLADPINNDAVNGNYPYASDNKNGEIVPITIGTFPVAMPAKFIRTAGKTTPFINSDILTHILPISQTCFPIVSASGSSPYIQYEIQLGLTDGYGTIDDLQVLVGWWIKIEIGGSADGTSLVGKYRKIVSVDSYSNSTMKMKFTVQSYFDKDLCASADATNQYTAWVSITKIPFEYMNDVWPCLGFIDENNASLNQATRLFYYDPNSKLMKPIASYGYDADVNNSTNSKLIINVEVFESDPDSVVSFDIFPLKNLVEYNEADLSHWGLPNYKNSNQFFESVFTPNIYMPYELSRPDRTAYSKSFSPIGSTYPQFDKDDSSYIEFNWTTNPGYVVQLDDIAAYEVDIDFSKILIEYSAYYLGINAESYSGNQNDVYANSPLLFMMRKFMGNPEYTLSQALGAKLCDEGTLAQGGGALIKNLPDFYYKVRTPDNSKAFYFSPNEVSQMRLISGYTNFQLPSITTIAQLKSIYKIGLLFKKFIAVTPSGSSAFKIKIRELSLICKSIGSIKDSIYSSVKGRVLGSPTTGIMPDPTASFNALSRRTSPPTSPTLGDLYWIDATATGEWAGHDNSRTAYNGSGWDYRAAYDGMSIYVIDESKQYIWDGTQLDGHYFDLLEDPIEILKHFKRLQCGVEFGDVVNYGKKYSTSIPIKIGSEEGSYDHASLTSIKAFRPAFQITEPADAWTDVINKKICSTFNLCTYIDSDGNECVTTLDKINPSETVAFADIVKGSIGEAKEPEVQDVFCQPILNYKYNSGSEKFDKQMLVQNIQAASYLASYTPGMDNTAHNLDVTLGDGEYIWSLCKTSYNKYRQIEQCPTEFSDQKLIATYIDAVKLLAMKILWMGKIRQSFAVKYSKGKNYHFGKHIKIKLPFQTVNLSVECLIGKATISKNNNRVDIDVVLLEDVPTIFFL